MRQAVPDVFFPSGSLDSKVLEIMAITIHHDEVGYIAKQYTRNTVISRSISSPHDFHMVLLPLCYCAL